MRGVGWTRRRLRGRRCLDARPRLSRRTSAIAQVQDPQRLGGGGAGRAQTVLDLEPLERGLRAGAEEPVHGAAGVAERSQDPLQRPHLGGAGRSPESGEATVNFPCKYEGADIEIGFNPTFLIEALRVVDSDEITLEMLAPNRPGLLKGGPDFLYVIMPVNLQ